MAEYKAQNNYEVYSDSQRTEMLKYIPIEAKKILDVGCSVGNFGSLLKTKHSSEVWGVEIDKQAAEIASQKLDKVLCSSFDKELNLPKNNFDCIIFNDVLEHMIDPYSALTYAKELLKKDGKIVASIPNVRFFDNMWMLLVHRSWEYQDWGILDRTHLRFFTDRSIASTFSNLGFKIEILEGINPLEETAAYQTKKFNFLNFVSFGRIEDMRWQQFAVVVSVQNL